MNKIDCVIIMGYCLLIPKCFLKEFVLQKFVMQNIFSIKIQQLFLLDRCFLEIFFKNIEQTTTKNNVFRLKALHKKSPTDTYPPILSLFDNDGLVCSVQEKQ